MLVSPADREKVLKNFLDRMTATFAKPRHLADESAERMALSEYLKLLARFRETELDAGWHRLASRHKISTWPVPAECIAACQEAREALGGRAAVIAPKREAQRDDEPDPPMDEHAARRIVASIVQAEALPAFGEQLGSIGRVMLRRGGFGHMAPPFGSSDASTRAA